MAQAVRAVQVVREVQAVQAVRMVQAVWVVGVNSRAPGSGVALPRMSPGTRGGSSRLRT